MVDAIPKVDTIPMVDPIPMVDLQCYGTPYSLG